MECVELDFLGKAKEIDPHFVELYEKITGHKLQRKICEQDNLYLNCD